MLTLLCPTTEERTRAAERQARFEQAEEEEEGSGEEGADCTGHVVPGARPCALGTFSYLVTSRSYFCLSYPNRFL